MLLCWFLFIAVNLPHGSIAIELANPSVCEQENSKPYGQISMNYYLGRRLQVPRQERTDQRSKEFHRFLSDERVHKAVDRFRGNFISKWIAVRIWKLLLTFGNDPDSVHGLIPLTLSAADFVYFILCV